MLERKIGQSIGDFDAMDKDGDGQITMEEFGTDGKHPPLPVRAMEPDESDDMTDQLEKTLRWQAADTNADGVLDDAEFVRRIVRSSDVVGMLRTCAELLLVRAKGARCCAIVAT